MTVNLKKISSCCTRSLLIFLFVAQILIFTCSNTWAGQKLPPLYEAELMVGDGPEVLAAISAMERDSQFKELERQRMGTKYFFNTTFGYSDEPLFETSTESATYSKLGIGAGLVFPIFGTWSKQKVVALESEIRSIESSYRPKILKLHNLAALRKAYITLWSECEKASVARRFLETEENVSEVMAAREKKGFLLPADRLEFLTAYDIVRRDIAASNMKKTQAIQIIRLATGRLWEMPEKMAIPTLPSFNALNPDIEKHPEISMRKETLKKYEELMREKRNIDSEGSVIIGATAAKDFPGEIGSGVYASVTINEPLGTAFSKEDKNKNAAEHELTRAKREEIFMRIKVQGEAEETTSLASYAVANIKAQESRLTALTEAVREKIMRHASVPGDTFEQLQKSRYQYYRGVIDLLDSEMIFMQTGADLLGYAYPDGQLSEPAERVRPIADNSLRSRMLDPDWLVSDIKVPGGNTRIIKSKESPAGESKEDVYSPASTRAADTADGSAKTVFAPSLQKKSDIEMLKSDAMMPKSVYIWDASPFLAPETRISSLEKLKANGFDHFLISFTAEQLKNLDRYYNRMELEDLLSVSQSMGIRADLLLGEPAWIYPDRRNDLISIIEKMKKFKFQGVHLDIEPDQEHGMEVENEKFIPYLTDTLKEVKSATDAKLSISVHPRYLEGTQGPLFAREAAADLEYVAVMIYTRNQKTAIKRMRNIMLMYPAVNFCLAQSVEKVLSPQESYFSAGTDVYERSMKDISSEFSNISIFKGVIIQAWEDIGGMLR